MNWSDHYQQHTKSVKEVVGMIRSGDRVVFPNAASYPSIFADAMVQNKNSYQNVEVVHMLMMDDGGYCHEDMSDRLRHNSLFVGGLARDAIAEGYADYTPCFFSRIPLLFDKELPADMAVVQVSPPDKHGYCSLGVSVDYTLAVAKKAALTIAQINRFVPRTLGDCFLHVNEIDYFFQADRPLLELAPPTITDVERQIGSNCASLIPDGATLQLGIGSLPDAVLLSLKDKNDLGLHTEMFSDGAVELMESGNINGKNKTLHKERAVATFLMGTQRLYDFVDDNPGIYMAPVTYVNDPYVIGQNNQLISINSCVQVDLMGQVCSESLGLRQLSAVGGQIDFVRGAAISPGGKSIIALPSTTANGTISKIVPFLDQGAAVTTSRNDVQYIITEYGIVQMWGKSLRDRARALIGIAHPKFRGELAEEFFRRFKQPYTPLESQ